MMRKIACCVLLMVAGAAPLLAATPDIVYIAYNGSDLHSCARTAPCQTITHGLAVVATGGIVHIVASGLYDTFTVNKAVTVSADPGIVATIDVAASGTGVTVSAGSGDVVTLRGLTLHGNGGTGVGFQVNSVGRVTLEDCISRNFAYGLSFGPSAASLLVVTGGTFDGSNTGLYMVAASSTAAVDGVTVFGGAGHAGIDAALSFATITNSLITNDGGSGPNQGEGVQVDGGTVVMEHDVISHYTSGVRVFATLYISSCNVTDNVQGLYIFSSAAYSRGNNTIVSNGTNVVGTLNGFSAQ
jgi:hypothetical protein